MKNILFAFLLSALAACQNSHEQESLPVWKERHVIANDLSNQKITAIAEDEQGHIWLGTFRGLNKYNVHEYHQYFCTNDSSSLPDNRIRALLLDSKKRLWISTANGTCLYTDKDNFQTIPLHSQNKLGVQLIENKDGRIFLNTITQLHAYNEDMKSFECLIDKLDPYYTYLNQCHIGSGNKLWIANPLFVRSYDSTTLQLKDSIPLQGYPIYSFLQDNGYLWLTGNHQIQILNTHDKQMKEVPEVIREHPVLSQASIELIHPYGEDALLLNTAKQGMFLYNYAKNFVVSQNENGFPFEVPPFKISQMFTDSQNNLWIGSAEQGYAVRNNKQSRFNNDNSLHTYMEKKSVTALAVDKEQHLWISTSMDGLYMYNLRNKHIEHMELPWLPLRTESYQKDKSKTINYLFVDDENQLWIVIDYQYPLAELKS